MYTIFNTPGPNFSEDHAITIAKNLFDLNVSVIKPLPSDRDQNFLLYQDNEPVYILKISHPAETFNVLNMQHKAIQHIYLMDDKLKLPIDVYYQNGMNSKQLSCDLREGDRKTKGFIGNLRCELFYKFYLHIFFCCF